MFGKKYKMILELKDKKDNSSLDEIVIEDRESYVNLSSDNEQLNTQINMYSFFENNLI